MLVVKYRKIRSAVNIRIYFILFNVTIVTGMRVNQVRNPKF